MALEILTAPLEIKLAGSSDAGEFTGYGAFFRNEDLVGDVIVPGAFRDGLAEQKAAGLPLPPMHFNHGLAELGGVRGVGVWTEMREDERGLRVKGRISGMSTDAGRYLYERVKDGAIQGISIGFAVRPNGAEFGTAGGRRNRTLKAVNLGEVSIVDTPANGMARIDGVKLAGIRDLETLLRRSGLSKSAARRAAEGGWPGLSREQQTDTPDFDMKTLDRALASNLRELKGLR